MEKREIRKYVLGLISSEYVPSAAESGPAAFGPAAPGPAVSDTADRKGAAPVVGPADRKGAAPVIGPADRRREAAESVWRRIEAMPQFRDAHTVLIYWSMLSEVPTGAFIGKWGSASAAEGRAGRKVSPADDCADRKASPADDCACRKASPADDCACRKRFVLPLVVGDRLVLKEYTGPESLVPGYRGIFEPSADAITVSPEEIDFAVIPGVAFDRKCRRMGRGKGFYDRLLPQVGCMKVGVGYDCQLLDGIPTDPWDVPLDAVVTPSEVVVR